MNGYGELDLSDGERTTGGTTFGATLSNLPCWSPPAPAVSSRFAGRFRRVRVKASFTLRYVTLRYVTLRYCALLAGTVTGSRSRPPTPYST